jgi:hypothetical protein
MANELEHIVRPAAEHTTLESHPVQVQPVSEVKHAEEAHGVVQEVGGSATGETTPVSIIAGESHAQFEEPKLETDKHFSAIERARYKGLAGALKNIKAAMRKGRNNAA